MCTILKDIFWCGLLRNNIQKWAKNLNILPKYPANLVSVDKWGFMKTIDSVKSSIVFKSVSVYKQTKGVNISQKAEICIPEFLKKKNEKKI